jgi:D-alanyl-D-alanine carboxypeptidase
MIDRKTGKVLFEKDMKIKHYPASLTKILTSLLILENLGSDEIRCLESQALFYYAFSNYRYRVILKKGNVIFIANGKKNSDSACMPENIFKCE